VASATRAKPSQTKPNQAKPSQTKPNQAKPSQTQPNQAKPSQTKADRAECRLKGLPRGSEKSPNRSIPF
jgi:hypothetical protein